MLTALPLVRDSAEPAYDQINDPTFNYSPGTRGVTPVWADSVNWSDEALTGLSDDVTHLTLQRGTLDKAAIDTLMRLKTLKSLELVNVDVPPELDASLHSALVTRQVERIYYTGPKAPQWMHSDPDKVSSMLYMKIGLLPAFQHLGMPNIQRLDLRHAFHVDHLNALPLVRGEQLLDTLICKSGEHEQTGKALAHLRVRHLILDGGKFGDNTALGLRWNTRIESVTLVDQALTREWVQQLLGMSGLQSLTIVRPQSHNAGYSWAPKPAAPVDEEFVSSLSSVEQSKITFSDHA